jgi:uncharacterized protein Yka (UPF0111/DUF47 family)
VVDVKQRFRWFLPNTPDVVGLLCEQAGATIEGMDAFVGWARGEPGKADDVREFEHTADQRKAAVRQALTEAFTTPIDAEDLYVMSERLDAVMNGAKDAVRESEVMDVPPDEPIADMASLIAEGVRHLADAFRLLEAKERHRTEGVAATEAATQAVRSQRRVEKVYRKAMSSLLGVDDLRELGGKRELYRRMSRISETLGEAADRVWYATIKEE